MPSWTAYARTGFILGQVEADGPEPARRKADARWPNEVAVLVESHREHAGGDGRRRAARGAPRRGLPTSAGRPCW